VYDTLTKLWIGDCQTFWIGDSNKLVIVIEISEHLSIFFMKNGKENGKRNRTQVQIR
jgi:hypothetical protein